jgi:tRNA isopentenyl-2-thiomethyl-A-37 hydroxylase MiaE
MYYPINMHTQSNSKLKAAQSAVYLIRKYAVDKESGDALLLSFRT